jgi:hypothetical protein
MAVLLVLSTRETFAPAVLSAVKVPPPKVVSISAPANCEADVRHEMHCALERRVGRRVHSQGAHECQSHSGLKKGNQTQLCV